MRVGISSTETSAEALLERVRASAEMSGANLSAEVSTSEPYVVPAVGEKRFTVAALDLGIKANTPRMMSERGIEVHVLPGHRDPRRRARGAAGRAVLLQRPRRPGGHDRPGRAAAAPRSSAASRTSASASATSSSAGRSGFGTYKLTYGHRGINQPVMDRTTGKVEVTAHNHGFAVDGRRSRMGRPRRRTASSPSRTSASTTTWSRASSCGRPDGALRRSRSSTTRRRPPARTTRRTSFDRFADLMARDDALMPKRTDIQSVLVIGSGPIVIGQACEFDYSGTQACRVLRAEGIRVVLVNSNPATIMTDPEFADATYVEPITPGVRRAGDRQGAPRRAAGHPRRPDRAQLRGRARRARACWRSTASS